MREDLKLIVLSLPYEMPTLEDFFEGVPIVDLQFFEEGLLPASTASQAIVLKHDDEKKRRTIIEAERLRQLDITYLPSKNIPISVQAANLAMKLHLRQDIKGDFIIFLPSKTVKKYIKVTLCLKLFCSASFV